MLATPGVVVRPLAPPPGDQQPPQVVNFGQAGVMRCKASPYALPFIISTVADLVNNLCPACFLRSAARTSIRTCSSSMAVPG
jgi:hypothetical protein